MLLIQRFQVAIYKWWMFFDRRPMTYSKSCSNLLILTFMLWWASLGKTCVVFLANFDSLFQATYSLSILSPTARHMLQRLRTTFENQSVKVSYHFWLFVQDWRRTLRPRQSQKRNSVMTIIWMLKILCLQEYHCAQVLNLATNLHYLGWLLAWVPLKDCKWSIYCFLYHHQQCLHYNCVALFTSQLRAAIGPRRPIRFTRIL